MTTIEKPFGRALVPGAFAPTAMILGALAGDAIRCGFGHTLFVTAILATFGLPIVAAFCAAGVAATLLIVGLYRGPFPLRRFHAACWIVAVAGCAAGFAYVMHDPSTTYCRIEL